MACDRQEPRATLQVIVAGDAGRVAEEDCAEGSGCTRGRSAVHCPHGIDLCAIRVQISGHEAS